MVNPLVISIALLFIPVEPALAQLTFPEDHGAHPDHRMESWYFSGRLSDEQGRQFAFHLGFFKLDIQADRSEVAPGPTSAWAVREIYRAEFGLSDLDGQEFQSDERISRAALGIAGAQASPVRVWVKGWFFEIPSSPQPRTTFRLHAASGDDAGIDLELEAAKRELIPEGQPGFAAGASGNPVQWYSLTRMTVRGSLQLEGRRYQVDGQAWLDRFWRSASYAQARASLSSGDPATFLAAGQVALNRFALQLDDGRELLCFELHRRDGSGVPIPSAILIDADGSAREIPRDEFVFSETRRWASPEGVQYPAGWRIHIPNEQLELEVIPTVTDQEVRQSVRYWSGAVNVTGQTGGRSVAGQGHAVLVGYGQSRED